MGSLLSHGPEEASRHHLIKPGKDQFMTKSYRETALTRALCKMFGRVINTRAVYFLLIQNILGAKECAFLSDDLPWSTWCLWKLPYFRNSSGGNIVHRYSMPSKIQRQYMAVSISTAMLFAVECYDVWRAFFRTELFR